MPDTVIVAAPGYLALLQEQGNFGDALAFSDADALEALQAITRDRPKVIALEKQFAATSRGSAFIKRITSDPHLRACEIRVVSCEGDAGGILTSKPPPAHAEAASGILDGAGTRFAPRDKVVEGLGVLIDGGPAMLIDMSLTGVQVLSSSVLRPNQRVRLVLPDETRPIRCAAGVAWSIFELPASGPRYRAGLELFEADHERVANFLERHRVG